MLVSPKLFQIFVRVLQARYWIIGAFLILAVAGIYGATRIPTDSAIERLVVAGDPVAQATEEFERVFPEAARRRHARARTRQYSAR
jgi:predicted RND superfamily exporter protein